MEIELFLDDRQQKTIGNRIQRGSLLQAIVYNEEKERYEYYLSKFEHAEFYSELDFIKTIGIQIKNTKVYKSCRLIFSVNDEDCIEFEDAEVYVNNNAKYWSGEFLELSEASTDEYNTKTSFNEIRKCLNINVKKQYPADHPILFNAFYGYFKKEKRTINYYDMLDEIMDGYVGTDMSKDDVERLKAKLESLPKTKKFDTQFTTNPDVISAKIKQTYEDLIKVIPEENIQLNEPMSKHTTFRIGGSADIFLKITKQEEIKQVLNITKTHNIPFFIMGNGSNLLVKDKGIRGIVAKMCINDYEFIDDTTIKVCSGMLNAKLARILLEQGLSGFEFAAGIPGTIGGAVRMNAGAYGSQMSNIVVSTRYVDLEDENYPIKEIRNIEHNFEYRKSIFSKKKAIILDTILKFEKLDKNAIEEEMKENNERRREKQPIDKPSAGSTFKRGENFITAQLIDECGLKGTAVGGAMVSEKHAGFIVNNNNATAEDVIKLAQIVKEKVYEKFNKKIELEIEIVGE